MLTPAHLVFCESCGAILSCLRAWTQPRAPNPLSVPAVTRLSGCVRSASICAATARSAVPLDWLTCTYSTRPRGCSSLRAPGQLGSAGVARLRRHSRDYGSVLDACVSSLRGSPRESLGGQSSSIILAPHAHVAGPSPDERAIHVEILRRVQASLADHLHRCAKQFDDRAALDQPVAVLLKTEWLHNVEQWKSRCCIASP